MSLKKQLFQWFCAVGCAETALGRKKKENRFRMVSAVRSEAKHKPFSYRTNQLNSNALQNGIIK